MSLKSKEEILNKIAIVRNKRTIAFSADDFRNKDILKPILPNKISCFKTELEAINGQCVIYQNESELANEIKAVMISKNLSTLFCKDDKINEFLLKHNIAFTKNEADFENMKAGITSCELLIARTGSVIVSSNSISGRQMNVFPPIHFIISESSQIIDYPEEAYIAIKNKYADSLPSLISTITGPSRTADIEKTLVLGAHGPKELIVFLSSY